MCVCACAGDRGVAWLACSIQRVMSAPINVGLCVRALVGLRLLCVFSFVDSFHAGNPDRDSVRTYSDRL